MPDATKPPPPEKCAVLVPVFGAIEPKCDAALEELSRRGYQVRRVRGYSQIDLARGQMATAALDDGFDETLWIDADIAFKPDDVETLRGHGLPLSCAIYVKKAARALACHAMPGTEEIVFGKQGGLLEILYAATGFLLARRQVYEDIQRRLELPRCNARFGGAVVPYFLPLIKPEPAGHWYLSEDYSFCERARQCGHRVWADTTIRLRHIGGYGYSWEEAGRNPARHATYRFRLSPGGKEGPASGAGGG